MMKYIIPTYIGDEDGPRMMVNLPCEYESYLLTALQFQANIGIRDFAESFDVIIKTAAKSCYIIYGDAVFWCVEWDPGLIIISIHNNVIKWCSLRSPVPNFGGRQCSDEELNSYDEDEINYQYKIIYYAWDSIFDVETRDACGFTNADDSSFRILDGAMTFLSSVSAEYGSNIVADWHRVRISNIKKLVGRGNIMPKHP